MKELIFELKNYYVGSINFGVVAADSDWLTMGYDLLVSSCC